MFFLSDVSSAVTAEFARRRGSRDRMKRKRSVLIGPPKTYGQGIRRDAATGAKVFGALGALGGGAGLGAMGAMNNGWKGALVGGAAGTALGGISGAAQGGILGAGVGAIRHTNLRRRRVR